MSKLDEKMELYSAEMKKLGVPVNATLLRAVAKACGPSIYAKDGEFVSASSKSEAERVKANFMTRKLGLSGADLDKGFDHAVEKMGKANRKKYRAIFYYIIVKKFKKESIFA